MVYNLTVGDGHTYFVEDGQGAITPIWVHNAELCDANKVPLPTMKSSDFGPKIADDIPKGVPKNWTREDIEAAILDYQTSIASRVAEQNAFAVSTASSEYGRVSHAQRISAEEGFLKSLLYALENRR